MSRPRRRVVALFPADGALLGLSISLSKEGFDKRPRADDLVVSVPANQVNHARVS